MGAIKKLFILGIFVGVGAVLYQLLTCPNPEVPKIEEKWFGIPLKAGEPLPEDPVAINKFSVNVSEAVLQDLKQRLGSARFVEPISDSQFNYGFNSDYLRKVVDYWKTKFDWRKQELILNKFSHYKTQISGINIHFIHVKPSKPVKTVVPLLLLHGWPGSVWEYYKAIQILIEPTNDIAFEIICPSLPGFGFSDPAQQPGLEVGQSSRIFVKLMERLNHKKFFVHGEDWGSIITRAMAALYPDNVRGIHITMADRMKLRGLQALKFFIGMYLPSLVFDEPEKDYKKLYPFMDQVYFILRETGYFHIQATKPDTVGAALIDSPVGLAAYILEKYSTATDRNNVNKTDGGLTQKFTLDELLTNVMIYWTSHNLASSLRFYKESVLCDYDRLPVTVPAAVADFPNEVSRAVRSLVKHHYVNLVQFTDMPRGGHFAAFEEPALLTDDIKSFIKTVLEIEKSAKTDKK